jgi:hypothetical protein
MKLPNELQPGDKFYFQYSIGEELKLWKVLAVGPHSLIASCENLYVKVPLYYEHLAKPEGHYCYVTPRPSYFAQLWAALSLKPVSSPDTSWERLAPQPANRLAV